MRRTIAIAPSTGADPEEHRPIARRVPHGPARRSGARAHVQNFGQLVGSHLGVALVGLASLPILARNLGPAAYGQFSLFMTTLGVLSNLDLARPILVRELSRSGGRDAVAARVLALTSGLVLAAVALCVGALVQGGMVALALGAAVLLHGLSSAAYAELSAQGKVGVAGSIRNASWAGALALTVGLSYFTATPSAYVWSFVAANLVILLRSQRAVAVPVRGLLVRPRVASLLMHRSQAGNIAAFAGASAVVASADKLLLERHASPDGFGHYAAQYDLATKINIVSTALGSILLPTFSRIHEEHGRDAAALKFVRVASWITLVYFGSIALLIGFNREVARLVLGSDFVRAGDIDVYVLMLVGVFIHLFGFLLTAYQRACGDFRSQRIAYIVSAAVMLTVGFATIPTYGAAGAVATYLCGRIAEVALIAVEVRRMPRNALPRWKVATLAAMLLALAAGAGFMALDGSVAQ